MPVTKLLYRDGFMYFLVIATCSVFNIVVWAALSSSYIALAKYFTFSFVTAMSSRLILNLRSLRRERDDGLWNNPSSGLELNEFPPSPSNYGPPSPGRYGRTTKHSTQSTTVSHVSFTLSPAPRRIPSRAMTLSRKTASDFDEKTRSEYDDEPGTPNTSKLFMTPSRRLEVQVDVDVDVVDDDGERSSFGTDGV